MLLVMVQEIRATMRRKASWYTVLVGNKYLADCTKEELAAWLDDALSAYRNRKPAGTE